MIAFLETKEDMQWLKDCHGVETDGFACAVVLGNEDWPDKVEIYRFNSVDSERHIYRPDDNGDLKLVKVD